MNFPKAVSQFFARIFKAIWQWLRHSHHAAWLTLVVAIAAAIFLVVSGYQEAQVAEAARLSALTTEADVSPSSLAFIAKSLIYMRLFAILGGIVYLVCIIRAWTHAERLIFPTWIASIYLTVWAILSHLYDRWQLESASSTGEVFSGAAFLVQMALLGILLMSIPIIVTYYARCKLLERYVMRSFLQPLIFCFIAFCILWIVMDLLDNLQDFRENNIGTGEILLFYIKLIPFIYVTVAPISLLLSTLYVLGRMSRTNELISILGAGKSMFQTLRPIYILGVYASFLSMAANYYWAPVSAGNKEKLLDVKERLSQGTLMRSLVYRNHESKRMWFVGLVPRDMKHDKMRRIEIRQEDEKGHLKTAWFAKSAFWRADTNEWTLYTGVEVNYEKGQIVGLKNFEEQSGKEMVSKHSGWPETPWMLLSGAIIPDYLGVPEIVSYLRANESYEKSKLSPYITHLYYRFALPWHCLIVVMFAAPLAVVFSRRGLVGGMARAVMFFFVLLFLDNLFLNLGKGRHIPAILAVWMPHILLGGLGLFLFFMRSTNREIPQISFKKWFKKSPGPETKLA